MADPKDLQRNRVKAKHGIPEDRAVAGISISILLSILLRIFFHCYPSDWRDLASTEKFADTALICLPDALHEVRIATLTALIRT